MKTVKISLLSKVLLLIVTGLFLGSLYFPMWQIDLDAPQYPEGLNLKLHANKIGGDVEIINGLNHYIGMKTLHADDFIEFTVLNKGPLIKEISQTNDLVLICVKFWPK